MRIHLFPAKAATVLVALTMLFGALSSEAGAVPTFEWNQAADKNTEPSNPSTLPCEDYYDIKGCFQPYGDKFWIYNSSNRDANAAIFWSNFYPTDSKLYRHGACYSSAKWAWVVCDKNMYENSKIRFWVCNGTSSNKVCSARKETRA